MNKFNQTEHVFLTQVFDLAKVLSGFGTYSSAASIVVAQLISLCFTLFAQEVGRLGNAHPSTLFWLAVSSLVYTVVLLLCLLGLYLSARLVSLSKRGLADRIGGFLTKAAAYLLFLFEHPLYEFKAVLLVLLCFNTQAQDGLSREYSSTVPTLLTALTGCDFTLAFIISYLKVEFMRSDIPDGSFFSRLNSPFEWLWLSVVPLSKLCGYWMDATIQLPSQAGSIDFASSQKNIDWDVYLLMFPLQVGLLGVYAVHLPFFNKICERLTAHVLVSSIVVHVSIGLSGYHLASISKILCVVIPLYSVIIELYLKWKEQEIASMEAVANSSAADQMMAITSDKIKSVLTADDLSQSSESQSFKNRFLKLLLGKSAKMDPEESIIWDSLIQEKEINMIGLMKSRGVDTSEMERIYHMKYARQPLAAVDAGFSNRQELESNRQDIKKDILYLVVSRFVHQSKFNQSSCLIKIDWMLKNKFVMTEIQALVNRVLSFQDSFKSKYLCLFVLKLLESKLAQFYRSKEDIENGHRDLNNVGLDLQTVMLYKVQMSQLTSQVEEFAVTGSKTIQMVMKEDADLSGVYQMMTKLHQLDRGADQTFRQLDEHTLRTEYYHLVPRFYHLLYNVNLYRSSKRVYQAFATKLAEVAKITSDMQNVKLDNLNVLFKSTTFRCDSSQAKLGRIKDVYGYKSHRYTSCINRKAEETIMPPMYSSVHVAMMRGFMESEHTDRWRNINLGFTKLPHQQQVFRSVITVKIVPSLNEDFDFMVGVRPVQLREECYVVVNQTGFVDSYSKELTNYIPKDFLAGGAALKDVSPKAYSMIKGVLAEAKETSILLRGSGSHDNRSLAGQRGLRSQDTMRSAATFKIHMNQKNFGAEIQLLISKKPKFSDEFTFSNGKDSRKKVFLVKLQYCPFRYTTGGYFVIRLRDVEAAKNGILKKQTKRHISRGQENMLHFQNNTILQRGTNKQSSYYEEMSDEDESMEFKNVEGSPNSYQNTQGVDRNNLKGAIDFITNKIQSGNKGYRNTDTSAISGLTPKSQTPVPPRQTLIHNSDYTYKIPMVTESPDLKYSSSAKGIISRAHQGLQAAFPLPLIPGSPSEQASGIQNLDSPLFGHNHDQQQAFHRFDPLTSPSNQHTSPPASSTQPPGPPPSPAFPHQQQDRHQQTQPQQTPIAQQPISHTPGPPDQSPPALQWPPSDLLHTLPIDRINAPSDRDPRDNDDDSDRNEDNSVLVNCSEAGVQVREQDRRQLDEQRFAAGSSVMTTDTQMGYQHNKMVYEDICTRKNTPFEILFTRSHFAASITFVTAFLIAMILIAQALHSTFNNINYFYQAHTNYSLTLQRLASLNLLQYGLSTSQLTSTRYSSLTSMPLDTSVSSAMAAYLSSFPSLFSTLISTIVASPPSVTSLLFSATMNTSASFPARAQSATAPLQLSHLEGFILLANQLVGSLLPGKNLAGFNSQLKGSREQTIALGQQFVAEYFLLYDGLNYHPVSMFGPTVASEGHQMQEDNLTTMLVLMVIALLLNIGLACVQFGLVRNLTKKIYKVFAAFHLISEPEYRKRLDQLDTVVLLMRDIKDCNYLVMDWHKKENFKARVRRIRKDKAMTSINSDNMSKSYSKAETQNSQNGAAVGVTSGHATGIRRAKYSKGNFLFNLVGSFVIIFLKMLTILGYILLVYFTHSQSIQTRAELFEKLRTLNTIQLDLITLRNYYLAEYLFLDTNLTLQNQVARDGITNYMKKAKMVSNVVGSTKVEYFDNLRTIFGTGSTSDQGKIWDTYRTQPVCALTPQTDTKQIGTYCRAGGLKLANLSMPQGLIVTFTQYQGFYEMVASNKSYAAKSALFSQARTTEWEYYFRTTLFPALSELSSTLSSKLTGAAPSSAGALVAGSLCFLAIYSLFSVFAVRNITRQIQVSRFAFQIYSMRSVLDNNKVKTRFVEFFDASNREFI